MQFRNLAIGQTFDFVNDSVLYNSFFKRCTKTSNTAYRDSDGHYHSVGTTRAEVFHIDRPERPYVSVVIKGDQKAAEWAAAARNVPFTFSNGANDGTESVGYVPVDHLLAVMRWFGESGSAPFPVGTCLLFSHHEAKEDDLGEGSFIGSGDAAMVAGWEEREVAAERAARGDIVNVGEFEPVILDRGTTLWEAMTEPKEVREQIANALYNGRLLFRS